MAFSLDKVQKATRLRLQDFSSPQMRAFHMTWMAFFVCFFAWFAVAPLMPMIKGEFGLNKDQIANITIAAVAVTILVRLIIGPLCDRIGPRKAYTGLLLIGSVPVIGIAFAQSYEAFLVCRLAIGAIGASFVITQYHTSVMFAPNVVGTANAAAAGWGNAGGGFTQSVMPFIVLGIVALGAEKAMGWRYAMAVPGGLMLIMAVLYWKFTQDCPQGNYAEMRAAGIPIEGGKKGGWAIMLAAMQNYRVWMLFVTYGACFGVEIFIHNVAATYYVDTFKLSLTQAGLAAGIFGGLALFARALGGIFSDKLAAKKGLDGRTLLLFSLIVGEGLFLMLFAKMDGLVFAILSMTVFGLFTHMACGATYALVPFIDRDALGGVAGIIGAGGNVGAVLAGFLMKSNHGDAQTTLFTLGSLVAISAVCVLAVRFSSEHKAREEKLYQDALLARAAMA